MRRSLGVLAAVTASLYLVVPGAAQQTSTPGQFVGGFTPGNIVQKPIDLSNVARPINMQQATMPQSFSNKVLNISQVFHKVQMPLFRSQAPNVPIVQGGKNNPIQPADLPKLNVPQQQPTRVIYVQPQQGQGY
jgi:hypothetical protein